MDDLQLAWDQLEGANYKIEQLEKELKEVKADLDLADVIHYDELRLLKGIIVVVVVLFVAVSYMQ